MGWSPHGIGNSLSRVRILQPLIGDIRATIVNPRRHAGTEPSRTRGVRVHVGGYFHAFAASVADHRQNTIKLRPVSLARSFEVVDFGRKFRLATDANSFFDCLAQLVCLAANVSGVFAFVLRSYFTHLD